MTEPTLQELVTEHGKALEEYTKATVAEKQAKARRIRAKYNVDYFEDELRAKKYELMAV